MGAFRSGAAFLGVSGFLNVLASGVASFAPDTIPLLVLALVYVVLARLLNRRGARWLAWIVFLMMLILPILAFSQIGVGYSAPDWMIYLIIGANILCAISLFVALWRGPERTQEPD